MSENRTNPVALAHAESYVKAHGDTYGLKKFDKNPSELTINPELGARVGRLYQRLPHSPRNPKVKAAYDQFKREILQQYLHLKHLGVEMTPWTQPGQPYKNSREMRKDVRENNRLYYFPTLGTDSFGYGETPKPADNPLLELTGEHTAGYNQTYNDLFRAVHDYFGHAVHGHEFGPQGELRAWEEHAKMFSPLARHALSMETHGQNSWVNFGPHNPGHMAPPLRPFAEQKTNLLPEKVWPKKLARNPKVKSWVQKKIKLLISEGKTPSQAAGEAYGMVRSGWNKKHPLARIKNTTDNFRALVSAIQQYPNDTTPRKMLADYLEETGYWNSPRMDKVVNYLRRDTAGPLGTKITKDNQVHITLPDDPVVTVARDGARTDGYRPIWTTGLYRARPHQLQQRQNQRDLALGNPPQSSGYTWRREGGLRGHNTSGDAPTGPMITRAKRFAEENGLDFRTNIRHGMPAEDRMVHIDEREKPKPTELPEHDPNTAMRSAHLARKTPYRQESDSSALSQSYSVNAQKRKEIAEQIVKEAGLTPSAVRQVLSHEQGRGVRSTVLTAIQQKMDPGLAKYIASWFGLLAREQSLTVFHPNDAGRDRLHIIHSDSTPIDEMGDYLNKAGIPKFSVEESGNGSRAFVFSPNSQFDPHVARISRGLNASVTSYNGTGFKLGSTTDSDARAKFRDTISDFERTVGPERQ